MLLRTHPLNDALRIVLTSILNPETWRKSGVSIDFAPFHMIDDGFSIGIPVTMHPQVGYSEVSDAAIILQSEDQPLIPIVKAPYLSIVLTSNSYSIGFRISSGFDLHRRMKPPLVLS